MTRMTGPECAVMRNLINIHTYIPGTYYIHIYIHTYIHTYINTYGVVVGVGLDGIILVLISELIILKVILATYCARIFQVGR